MLAWARLQASVEGFLLPALQSQNTFLQLNKCNLEIPYQSTLFTFSLKYLDDPADR